MTKFDKIITAIALPIAVGVAVTDVGRPAFSGQPATHASHGACFTSPPIGEYQARGCGR